MLVSYKYFASFFSSTLLVEYSYTKFILILADPNNWYPFFYRPMYTILEDGWTTFRPETEFSKLVSALSEEWRFSYVNKDYNVSFLYFIFIFKK